jgi:cobalt-zinc-cadmium efflux system membrane fusion protein
MSSRPQARSVARSVVAALPTLFVLGGIAAVGYWGHHTGWKAAKFSQLFGARPAADKEDWCAEHNVPDSECIACHPELAGENPADWCKEHGVPESKDTVCHPEILTTGVASDWCAEHNLPESGCTFCHPEITRKGELPPDADAPVVSGGAAKRDPRTCQKHALKVQFASVAALAKCGVRLGQVVERPMSDSILVNAEVDYVRTRFAKLAPRVSGTARQVERVVGESVRAGDILALIDSAEVGRAQAELLQAQTAVELTSRSLERVQLSSAAGFRTEAERLAAEAGAREAEIRLINARQALATLSADATSANLVPVSAPFDGVVVSRAVVTGEVVDPARTLFEIADVSRMWVTLDVPEAEAQRVTLGEEVVFRPDGAPDDAALGRVAWMSTAVDEMTRTVKVRAEVENATGSLRAHSFGRARIILRTSPQAVAVPTEAVQWEGCCFVVFVRVVDAIFQTRKVRIGAKDAAYTEVLGGVLPGEIVATTGSHVLKSEILKSSLGAGCCPGE